MGVVEFIRPEDCTTQVGSGYGNARAQVTPLDEDDSLKILARRRWTRMGWIKRLYDTYERTLAKSASILGGEPVLCLYATPHNRLKSQSP